MCSIEVNTEKKCSSYYVNALHFKVWCRSLRFKITFVKDVKNNEIEYNIMNAFMSVHAWGKTLKEVIFLKELSANKY